MEPNEYELDTEALTDLQRASLDFFEEQDTARAQEQATVDASVQSSVEQRDPREAPDGGGFKRVAQELGSAITGGLQDTASSIATFPERTADMLSGAMKDERDETGTYTPDWTPFVDEANPIITKTWWGGLLRGVVHFGTMAAGITAAASAAGISAPASIAGMAGYSLIRAAGIGAVADIISKESDGHNALGSLRDRYGWMDTPLSTKNGEHPLMWKLKNVVEGMGIGAIFDGASMLLGKGSKAARAKVSNRAASIDDQNIKQGLAELRSPEFRATKNAPLAKSEQGAKLSEDDPFIVWENQKKIRTTWGAEDGSAGNIVTAVQKERIAREADVSEELVEETLRKLLSADKFRRIIEETRGSRQRLAEVFGDAVAAHQRITSGRNAADMPATEYLNEILESFDIYDSGTPEEIATITSKNIVVADLVVGTLLQQVRDLGIAGRELANYTDLTSIDGPAEQIVDTMLTALTETRRARIVKSDNFRQIGAGKKREFLQQTLSKEMEDTRESIATILDIASAKEDGGELLMALFEAFSSMKTVNSLDDFDAWARKMIRGGEIEGKAQTGAVIRELQGVTVHSILSGPKTPLRAIMGTATATFARPMATVLGASLRGDVRTSRAALASMNAMMQAIPESWQLFRSKLDGYWSGDISTIKTRFQEYTRDDQNWEILRRWAEDSGRATEGDKAAFALANMARAANDSNFLTYSTKIMAATDDSMTYILGRAKAREKAMLSALDAQDKGFLSESVDISPELIKYYEDDFYSEIFDGNGDILDKATQYARKEVTLTKELSGFAGTLNQAFQANPWARPFFYFARTGVNGLELTAKHTPGFNFLVREFNDIARANQGTLDSVAKYGINTIEELNNAKALQTGRLAMGSGLISMASWSWMSGNMTGNGPIDRQKRQVWIDAGWRPRQIKLGEVWVDYESFEPFNNILATIADIGDASELMGNEWTEQNLLKMSFLVAQGITGKSYLAGMQQFVDLFSGKPGQAGRVAAGLLNNQVPLAGLRNELGKIFTPYQRELNSGIFDAIRNRNLITEQLAGEEELPIKYDILTGRPLKPYDFLTRIYRGFIPAGVSLDYSKGKQMLFDSGFDLRTSIYYAPDGTNLTDYPKIRSMFAEAIGKYNIQHQLDILADDPEILASIAEMKKDLRNGNRTLYEGKDYYHNMIINNLFRETRKKAWLDIIDDPFIQQLIAIESENKYQRQQKMITSANSNVNSVLTMYR